MKALKYFFLALIFFGLLENTSFASCHQLRVAVLDTGLNLNDIRFKKHLCLSGHKDFVLNETINDVVGHGTHVAGLIEKYAGNSNYCMVIYKYYSAYDTDYNAAREHYALSEIAKDHIDIVNFSGGGPGASQQERDLIKNNTRTKFVVAAGNNGEDLDIPGNEYYPASYWLPNEYVVMGLNQNYTRSDISNYSERTLISEPSEHILSYLPNGQTGYLSGTSMATAIFTGKLVDKLSKTCDSK